MCWLCVCHYTQYSSAIILNCSLSLKGKGGKGKSKGKPPVAVQEDISDTGDVTMSEFNKLRSLDVFAGVGGN